MSRASAPAAAAAALLLAALPSAAHPMEATDLHIQVHVIRRIPVGLAAATAPAPAGVAPATLPAGAASSARAESVLPTAPGNVVFLDGAPRAFVFRAGRGPPGPSARP